MLELTIFYLRSMPSSSSDACISHLVMGSGSANKKNPWQKYTSDNKHLKFVLFPSQFQMDKKMWLRLCFNKLALPYWVTKKKKKIFSEWWKYIVRNLLFLNIFSKKCTIHLFIQYLVDGKCNMWKNCFLQSNKKVIMSSITNSLIQGSHFVFIISKWLISVQDLHVKHSTIILFFSKGIPA